MSNLSNRLHAWALNNEMIDVHFTEHGCDCVSASELLVQQDAEIERLQERIRIQEELLDYANKAEIERLRAALVADDEGSTAYQSGWHARDAEVERLRLENSQWQSACAGYTEALAARDRDNAALLEKLARIRDQIAKHNISIKEAIRRGEAFEWKTLTLDS